ncbi:RNA polymerase sigma-54 factor 1 [Anaerohalosphaera lusitana]|uniref:RNA polymerase sigma-54 factor 1 n=1 Tax=Anaerohalosphaera lusitana TaxID=1936003 RepID=A0A1U9NHM2_9BACT|nr:RNA polymerase factor sigma-54 [Anaerohalosphaera lusitana]AQT67421.1 RNA polymerase sigma-54 factor 1 [Anaerohalosphaera lusitana]
MKMSMTGQMRLEQRMKLAPRMIQSMEVLQLPLLALQEKIEAELNSNPVLEIAEERIEAGDEQEESACENLDEKELVVDEKGDNTDDFERLDSINDDFGDYFDQSMSVSARPKTPEKDKKLEAMQNTASSGLSLRDSLLQQWALIDAEDEVKQAGEHIIDYIDEKGYLTTPVEELDKEKHPFNIDHLREALQLVQKLEPAGVGARDLRECMLIQIDQFPEDMSLERKLVEDHWSELLENRLPQIAKKMNVPVELINHAIKRLSKLDTSPGLRVGRDENHPITADVIVEPSPDGGYSVSLAEANMPNLRVNRFYSQMARNRKVDDKTRQFLQKNIHSAQWLMDAIVQRKQTLLQVAQAIVNHQQEYFEKGKLFLKPLPMATIADEVGVHVATVSRAVAGKYMQCPQGLVPLRGFFSGGTKNASGKMQSWDAVKAELQRIVEAEDKSKPLNDDQIRQALADKGIENIARRTVAKYRKLLNIPSARFRKKF